MPSTADARGEPETVLAIDFGTKRIGFAAAIAGLATPLETWTRTSWGGDVARIRHWIQCHEVQRIVVGLPTLTDGRSTASTERAKAFVDRLAAEPLEVPVDTWDEALTSWEADERMEAAGVPADRRKMLRDAYSALVLLEDYLASKGS